MYVTSIQGLSLCDYAAVGEMTTLLDKRWSVGDKFFSVRPDSVLSDLLLGRVMVMFHTWTRFLCLNQSWPKFPLLLEKEEFYNEGWMCACIMCVFWGMRKLYSKNEKQQCCNYRRGCQREWKPQLQQSSPGSKISSFLETGARSTMAEESACVCVCVLFLSSFPELSWMGGRVV